MVREPRARWKMDSASLDRGCLSGHSHDLIPLRGYANSVDVVSSEVLDQARALHAAPHAYSRRRASSNFCPSNPESLQTNARILKIYFCSKPGNESMPANPAHIGIVLNHRLDKERPIKQQYVELNAVLGLPGSHAGNEET